MAKPLSRRALLTGRLFGERSAQEPESSVSDPNAAEAPRDPPTSEVTVYGTQRPAPKLSVERAQDESPPPWMRDA